MTLSLINFLPIKFLTKLLREETKFSDLPPIEERWSLHRRNFSLFPDDFVNWFEILRGEIILSDSGH